MVNVAIPEDIIVKVLVSITLSTIAIPNVSASFACANAQVPALLYKTFFSENPCVACVIFN